MTIDEKEIYEYAKSIMENKETEFEVSGCSLKKGYTERCIEVPWVASNLNKYKMKSLLDIGFTFASHDYLRMLLDFNKQNELNATDIIEPKKVQNRYPSEWWQEIEQVPVYINDISAASVDNGKKYDAATLISTMEHVGFDKTSVTMAGSAFERAKSPQEVIRKRDDNTEQNVLNNISKILKGGGYCFISVPAGKGGAILLRDSMGLYTCEWEYEKESWKRITGHNQFECIEQRFFALKNNMWTERESIDELAESTAAMKDYATGVACCVLKNCQSDNLYYGGV